MCWPEKLRGHSGKKIAQKSRKVAQWMVGVVGAYGQLTQGAILHNPRTKYKRSKKCLFCHIYCSHPFAPFFKLFLLPFPLFPFWENPTPHSFGPLRSSPFSTTAMLTHAPCQGHGRIKKLWNQADLLLVQASKHLDINRTATVATEVPAPWFTSCKMVREPSLLLVYTKVEARKSHLRQFPSLLRW